MSTNPPLPLSEQILFWTVQAIGRGDARFPKGGTSWPTAKRAGKAAVLRDWDGFVGTCLRALEVDDPEAALGVMRAALRRWDERVGSLPLETELSDLERYHPVLVWAIPVLGLRLGALAASLAWRTDTPIEDWFWLTDPFARDFFGKVVDRILYAHDPRLTTRQRRKEELDHDKVIDARTYERWFAGETAVPEIEAIEKLVAYLGGDTDGPLRLARLAAVLREDLDDAIGSEAFEDWRVAVRDVAVSTARLLHPPTEVASLCDILAGDLRGPLGSGILRHLGVPPDSKPEEVASALAKLAARLREGPMTPELRAACAQLVAHQVATPHPTIGTVVGIGLGMPMMGILAAGDPLAGSANPWALRSVCRALATKENFEYMTAGGKRHQRGVPGKIAEAARRWLTRSLRFRTPAGEDPNADALEVLFWLAGGPGSLTLDLGAAFLQLLGPEVEPHLTDEQVEASPYAAALRARRFAEAGRRDEALRWLPHATSAPAGLQATAHIAATLLAIAHGCLDSLRSSRRHWRGRWASAEAEPQRIQLVATLEKVEVILAAAGRWLAAPEGTAEALDAVAALFPVKLRLASFRRTLGADVAGVDARAVEADVERLRVGLALYPNRGAAWSALALWERWSGGEAELSARRAEHWGAGDQLARHINRLAADLSEDAGASES